MRLRFRIYPVVVLCGIALLVGVPAYADSANLFINAGTGPTDPNQIPGGSFTVTFNPSASSKGTITDLVLIFSVPNLTGLPSGITGLASGSLTVGSIAFAGLLATSPTCLHPSPPGGSGLDVYSCANIDFNANQSNSLTNFNLANLAINGITASSYGIFEVTIFGVNLTPGNSITVSGNLPAGTFVDAYGVNGTGDVYTTPFTESALSVPEPGSLTLLGVGLLGLFGLARRKLVAA